MPVSEKNLYNISRLNVLFAVSSGLLLATMLSLAVVDYDQQWRPFQNSYMDVQGVLAELDYGNEAYNAYRLGKSMEQLPGVSVPAVFGAYSTSKVLTMEDLAAIDSAIGVPHCKNLFLCNRQETDFYLQIMQKKLRLLPFVLLGFFLHNINESYLYSVYLLFGLTLKKQVYVLRCRQ